MARRKPWDDLSDAYRKRLTRAGITRADYESGVSLSAARGHAATPERPERAERNPKKYATYLRRQNPAHVVHVLAEYVGDDGITRYGVVAADIPKKKDRSTVASHWNAVSAAVGAGAPEQYRQTAKSLASFAGVRVGGYPDPNALRNTGLIDPTKYVRFALITDPTRIALIAAGNGFVFESFYRYSSAA